MSAKPVLHRDSIHQDTWFDPLSAALIDSAPMQRLGRVLQLGYAHLVYRGGTHTRLSHVMGASHVAGKLVEQLRHNYEGINAEFSPATAASPEDFLPCKLMMENAARKPKADKAVTPKMRLAWRWEFLEYVCRWAALLHDIGHIPLGHTLEDEFDQIFKKHDDFYNPRLATLWLTDGEAPASDIASILRNSSLYPKSFSSLGIDQDDVYNTVLLICCHKEKRESEGDPGQTFIDLLGGKPPEDGRREFVDKLISAYSRQKQDGPRDTFTALMADLVANTICADYLDYMRRDPSYVGLDVLRDDRVASRFYVGLHHRWGHRMALSLVDRQGKRKIDTATGVFELVRQRFRFAETIYYHKTKVSASAMFVKALTMLNEGGDVLEAHGRPNKILAISDVNAVATDLANGVAIDSLTKAYLPGNLLSPDLGDDSINLFLQRRAWDNIRRIRESSKEAAADEIRIKRNLLAISLLGGISRRQLYKLALTLDSEKIGELANYSLSEGTAINNVVKRVIDRYRPDHDLRTKLESKMCAAAKFDEGSLILYVPERKSQAKGVETFALSDAGIETLGSHSSLHKKMVELINDYKGLWKFMVFVHPMYAEDWAGVSRAVDVLIEDMLTYLAPKKKVREKEIQSLVADAMRGPYLQLRHREGIEYLRLLLGGRRFDTRMTDSFLDVERRTGSHGSSLSGHEHASLAYIHLKLSGLSAEVLQDASETMVALDDLCRAGALTGRLKEASKGAFENYGGKSDSEVHDLRGTLDGIAHELLTKKQ